jgi:hypothetical protein
MNPPWTITGACLAGPATVASGTDLGGPQGGRRWPRILTPRLWSSRAFANGFTSEPWRYSALKHLARTGGGDPFEERGPPGGGREAVGTEAGAA